MFKIGKTQTILAIFLLMSLFLCGCKRITGLSDRYAKRKITESEIIGTWIASEDSMSRITKEGYNLFNKCEYHTLIFKEENKCIISTYENIPPSPISQEERMLYLQNQEAEWHIGEKFLYVKHVRKSVPAIIITITNKSHGINGDIGVEEIKLNFYIADNREGLVLWRYIGDPDYCEYLDFTQGDK
jgi:hypothetical protein